MNLGHVIFARRAQRRCGRLARRWPANDFEREEGPVDEWHRQFLGAGAAGIAIVSVDDLRVVGAQRKGGPTAVLARLRRISPRTRHAALRHSDGPASRLRSVTPLGSGQNLYRAVIAGVCVPPVRQLGPYYVAVGSHLVVKSQGAAGPNKRV